MGSRLVAVGHLTGSKAPNTPEFTEDNRRRVVSRGGVVFTGIRAFTGVGQALRKKFNMDLHEELIANTLR